MNDEVVHTGYAKLAHYIFALCCGLKTPDVTGMRTLRDDRGSPRLRRFPRDFCRSSSRLAPPVCLVSVAPLLCSLPWSSSVHRRRVGRLTGSAGAKALSRGAFGAIALLRAGLHRDRMRQSDARHRHWLARGVASGRDGLISRLL